MCVNERSTSSKAVEGFTLLEIMIAAGVMAMGLVLVFGALVSIAETNQTSQTRTVANAQVNSVLEEVQALGPVELASYQPPPMPGLGAGATLQVVAVAADGSQIALPVSDTGAVQLPNPVEVSVTVAWRDVKGRTMTSRASTYVGS